MEDNKIFYEVSSYLRESDSFKKIIEKIEKIQSIPKDNIFIIDRPIMDSGNYEYLYESGFLILIKNYRIMFVTLDEDPSNDGFKEYVEDFLEDTGALARKYSYTQLIGRTRDWKKRGVIDNFSINADNVKEVIETNKLGDIESRVSNLIISLLTGSINDISTIDSSTFERKQTLLESVKNRITLFDTNQTRFVYQENENQKVIRIQGLAGAGKTELLLHKLKKIYTENKDSRIAFSCFNKVLADKLRGRVPEFFDYMKVDEQINYNRLFIASSWGSRNNPNSGLYTKICSHYNLQWQPFSRIKSKKEIWKDAIAELEKLGKIEPLFDYILLDESQDFEDEYIKLCELVTRKKVYVAGDILQDIFSINKGMENAGTDFILNKVYRTDPRTVLFSHVLGFGLYEERAVRWLSENEWRMSGYDIRKVNEGKYHLSREPFNRFGEDMEASNYEAIIVKQVVRNQMESVIDAIDSLKNKYEGVLPSDIAVIYTEFDRNVGEQAEALSKTIFEKFSWNSVIAPYEKRINDADEVLITNINNVKGLEFSFVIIVNNRRIKEIDDETLATDIRYRNALYMALTRSFVTSTIIFSKDDVSNKYFEKICNLAEKLNNDGAQLEILKPDNIINEKELYNLSGLRVKSQLDVIEECFDELGFAKDLRNRYAALLPRSEKISNGTTDKKIIMEVIKNFIKAGL